MKTEIIKLDPKEPDIKLIKKAAKKVDAGAIAAFPTETVYGLACRVREKSLEKLSEIKDRTESKYYTLHIGDIEQVFCYVPQVSLRVQKLIHKAWPGPLTIVFELQDDELELIEKNAKKEVFDALYNDKTIGIRCPDNPIAIELLKNIGHPVIAPSANLSGKEAPSSAEPVIEEFNGKIEIILDGGATKYKKSSTVVKPGNKGIEILRQGYYSLNTLEKFWKVQILSVCTGNTCRSPMAEGLFKMRIAEKLGCEVDELGKIGYKVSSAGTMGASGWPASPESVEVCRANGIDISGHTNTALTKELIDDSDLIYTMSGMHREMVLDLCPQSINKCFMIDDEKDVPDPIGQSLEIYDKCFKMIDVAIEKRLGEIKL
jgi:tRNA threonylcarbamoyl adenosine modification protein (Sua5/YciO/YrdC/YwlC family)